MNSVPDTVAVPSAAGSPQHSRTTTCAVEPVLRCNFLSLARTFRRKASRHPHFRAPYDITSHPPTNALTHLRKGDLQDKCPLGAMLVRVMAFALLLGFKHLQIESELFHDRVKLKGDMCPNASQLPPSIFRLVFEEGFPWLGIKGIIWLRWCAHPKPAQRKSGRERAERRLERAGRGEAAALAGGPGWPVFCGSTFSLFLGLRLVWFGVSPFRGKGLPF